MRKTVTTKRYSLRLRVKTTKGTVTEHKLLAIKHFLQTGLEKSKRSDQWIAGVGSKEKRISPTSSQGEHPLKSLPRDQCGRKALDFLNCLITLRLWRKAFSALVTAGAQPRKWSGLTSIKLVRLGDPRRFSSLTRLCGTIAWMRWAVENWLGDFEEGTHKPRRSNRVSYMWRTPNSVLSGSQPNKRMPNRCQSSRTGRFSGVFNS